ncbi:hypothetical protein DL96DRAFT_1183263 [Flagelloscypha sp. PMI_526]|nr:hypothetical protein DL96DRAFT_1183263 [Flagelloscypha sp. PMI_526]
MTAVGIWSIEIDSKKPQVVQPEADIRISSASFGESLPDSSGRSVVKLTYTPPGAGGDSDDDEEDAAPSLLTSVAITALTAGKNESTTLDLVLMEGAPYKFEVIGKNPVHLYGNYVIQNTPYNDESDDESDMDDEGYDLELVSSDVEVEADPAELDDDDDGRFEEITDEKPTAKKAKGESADEKPAAQKAKGNKRPLEDEDTPSKLSKADKKKAKKLKAADGSAAPAPTVENSKAVKQPSGLVYTDAKVGTGDKAKKGDTLSMRYIGKLENGKEFDSNTKGKPFQFKLGKGQVIKGWDEGLVGMQVGGERTLKIPANLAYGKQSQPGIPSNSNLVFEVKLIGIKGR